MTAPFRFASAEQVPASLYLRTLEAVGRARTRAARIRAFVSLLFIAVSGAGSALAVRATLDAARTSGFASFASLALTDTSVIARHAQEFFLSLIETMPGLDIAATLLAVSVLLVSVRGLVTSLSRLSPDASIKHA